MVRDENSTLEFPREQGDPKCAYSMCKGHPFALFTKLSVYLMISEMSMSVLSHYWDMI